jgi:hypothetical protein
MPLTNYTILAKWMKPRHSDGRIQTTEVVPEINQGRAIKYFIDSLNKRDSLDLYELQIIDQCAHEVFGK